MIAGAASFKRNVAINYVSQVYVALVGIVMVPVYIRYMGVEAYGLVGFFSMLQAWLLLLDMGLSPLLVRELARFRAGALDSGEAARLVRSLEWLFGAMAVLCIVAIGLASNWIGHHWLTLNRLDVAEVVFCIGAMGAMIGQRWLLGIYRSGLVGMDKQGVIGVSGTIAATLRFAGVVPVLHFISASPTAFFVYQLLVMVFEMLLNRGLFYRVFPMTGAGKWPCWGALKPRLYFAGSMAYLGLLWGLIMQVDKLLLSHWLSLENYGYFSVAVTVAGGIPLFSVALVQALQPRIAVLQAQEDEAGVIRLYRGSTQFAAAFLMAIAGVMMFQGEPLLRMWTGNAYLAAKAAPVLGWYALGNAVFALQGIAFLLQYARGVTRWQVIGLSAFACLWIPALAAAVFYYGAVGSGTVWLFGNVLFLLVWISYVNGKLIPAIRWRWLFGDVAAVALAALFPAFMASQFDWLAHGRVQIFFQLVLIGMVSVLLACLAGSVGRAALLKPLRSRMG